MLKYASLFAVTACISKLISSTGFYLLSIYMYEIFGERFSHLYVTLGSIQSEISTFNLCILSPIIEEYAFMLSHTSKQLNVKKRFVFFIISFAIIVILNNRPPWIIFALIFVNFLSFRYDNFILNFTLPIISAILFGMYHSPTNILSDMVLVSVPYAFLFLVRFFASKILMLLYGSNVAIIFSIFEHVFFNALIVYNHSKSNI